MSQEVKNATGTANVPALPQTTVEVLEMPEARLVHMDKDFIYDIMSVPSHSGLEHRMVEYIVLWAVRNGIKYEFDAAGNIYLTKGELAEGEYYPCLTSHLDTVQSKHDNYINYNVPLEIKTELTKDGEHKIYLEDNIGIGADCKNGVCISLSIMLKVEKVKACFFLDEERGCRGSDKLEEEWFHDVGYVIGYDSPDLYRAAWSCSAVKLFSYDFYTKYMKPVCDKWGLKKGCFFSEPITDVMNIRRATKIICMNFGNGGYHAHAANEFSVLEHMDDACGMGLELIEHIGRTRHIHEQTSSNGTGNVVYYRGKGNLFGQMSDNDDIKQLKDLGDNSRYSGTYTYGYGAAGYGQANKPSLYIKEAELGYESVAYVVERYERHIDFLNEDVNEFVKKTCEENGVDFELFKDGLKKLFTKDITF